MNEIAKESLLFDCYGGLLTDRKRRVMELYHEENLSLAEIAEEFGISRAAVYDSLRSARRKLDEYEERLGMVEELARRDRILEQVIRRLASLEQAYGGDAELIRRTAEIRGLLEQLASE